MILSSKHEFKDFVASFLEALAQEVRSSDFDYGDLFLIEIENRIRNKFMDIIEEQ